MINYLPLLDYEHPVKAKWQDVFVKMRVHTQGYSPDHIFESRRPEESKNPEAFQYRKDNFRPVSKAPFDLAIDSYIECAQLLDVSISGSEVKTIEEETFVYDGLKKSKLREWYIKVPGAYRQTDPNSVVVVLPKHPTEIINPRFDGGLPNFDAIINQPIQVEIKLIPSPDIHFISPEVFVYKAGTWVWQVKDKKEYDQPYYFVIDKEYTYIAHPIKDGDKGEFKYQQIPFYFNDLEYCPAIPIGGKSISEEHEGMFVQYYNADYSGAAAWGDYSLGQMSDLQICERRFSYPEKWMVKKDCDALGTSWMNGRHVYSEDGGKTYNNCNACKGQGYIVDTSPLGTHLIDKKTGYDESGNFIQPVGFITPDVAILAHSASRTESYYDSMLRELGIIKQNMTEQSGISKAFDVAQKVTLITNIVTDIYRGYSQLLNAIEGFRFKKSDIVISLPEDFDVKNANDLEIELAEAKKNGLPYMALAELTERYMLKKFGDNEFNRWAQGVLKKYDKIYAYGLEETRNAKAILGDDITSFDVALHQFGLQILKEQYDRNGKPVDDILAILTEEVQKRIPQPVAVEI